MSGHGLHCPCPDCDAMTDAGTREWLAWWHAMHGRTAEGDSMSEQTRFVPDDGNPPAPLVLRLSRPTGRELVRLAEAQRVFVRATLRQAGIRQPQGGEPRSDHVLRAYEVLRQREQSPS